jgi:hypothetical protein
MVLPIVALRRVVIDQTLCEILSSTGKVPCARPKREPPRLERAIVMNSNQQTLLEARSVNRLDAVLTVRRSP